MPKVFGWEHLTFLAVIFTIMIVATIFIKKYVKSEKILTIVIKSLAAVHLICLIWNRYSLASYAPDWTMLIPDSFCGMSSLVLSISILVFKKDNIIFHFITYISFIGGLLTLFYPDFIGQNQSIFYSKTISALLHHAFLFYLPILTIITGYFKPALKKWFVLPIGLSFFLTYGLFLMNVFKMDDAMSITKPLIDGTILNWWFVGILIIVLQLAFLFIWECVKKKKNKIKIKA